LADRNLNFLHKPQINISCSSTGRMWLVSLCAFLCILQSALSDSGKSLIIAAAAVFSALLVEFLLTVHKHRAGKIKDGSAAATALILSMMLPNQIHPVYAALGAAFAIVVVKHSFGGLGSNWLNPALGGWLFIRFSWASAYADAFESPPPPISHMALTNVSALDNSVSDFLNSNIFSIFSVNMPSGYIDLLSSGDPGIITDRGIFILLIGTVVITAVGINRGWIPLVFLAVYCFLIRFAGDLHSGLWDGDILYGIFSGGTIAAAFILAAEPSSSAKFKPGIIFAVVLSAVLSWFFRYVCMDFSGCFTALALTNCVTPLIRLGEEKIFLSKNKGIGIQENLL